MPVGCLLTKRDLEILDALTRRVRILSLPQIARTWWPGSANGPRVAENRLRILVAEGLLHIERAPAHPEIQLDGPVASWELEKLAPDFGAVSYRLKARWREHPILTTCVSASKTAADRIGGYGGRPARAVERTHDLHMAQVYLFYRIHYPDLIPHWVFEEQIKAERRRARREPNPGEKLPDVIIKSGTATKVIEFGGAYSKEKLVAFHEYCKEHALPYEIW